MPWKIWALGSNGNGQLAVGHCNDVDQPTSCLLDQPPPFNVRPRKIIAGGNHAVLLYEDGSAYAAGMNDDGRCGLPPTPEPITAFRRIAFTIDGPNDEAGEICNKFVDITATWSSTTFVVAHSSTSKQAIYSCGTGDYGELGQGPDVSISVVPKIVMWLGHQHCVNLASSFRHIVLILSSGSVFGWGNGRKAQLGRDMPPPVPNKPHGSVWEPWVIIRLGCGVPDIRGCHLACGRDFTYMLPPDDYKNGYSLKAMSGLLGLDVKKDDKFGIKENALTGPCKELHANWNTLHAIDVEGALHSIGRNDKGQILPAKLKGNRVRNIKAGSEHSIAHIAVPGTFQNGKLARPRLWDEQCVILWGWGEHGNCGPLKPGSPWLSPQYTLSRTYSLMAMDGAELEPLGAGCATTFLMAYLDEESSTARSHTLNYMAFPRDCEKLRTNEDHEADEEYDSEDQLRLYWQIHAQVELLNTP